MKIQVHSLLRSQSVPFSFLALGLLCPIICISEIDPTSALCFSLPSGILSHEFSIGKSIRSFCFGQRLEMLQNRTGLRGIPTRFLSYYLVIFVVFRALYLRSWFEMFDCAKPVKLWEDGGRWGIERIPYSPRNTPSTASQSRSTRECYGGGLLL